MKAGQRLGIAFGAAALALAAAPALAQEAAPPPADTPATDSIGPRELQNYSIDGTVTRRADPPPAPRPATPPRTPAPRATPPQAEPGAAIPPADRPSETRTAASRDPASASANDRPRVIPRAGPALSGPAPSVTVPLPPLDGRVSDSAAADPVAEPEHDPRGLASGPAFRAWPWLLAALALVLGGLFLWRSRGRHALAGAPHVDAFVAPEPPAPDPAPPQPAPLAPSSLGVVSTRLRPRLELQFNPLRCSVDDERVVVDFELELINNGSAPARAVLIEASLFNAGVAQDEAIGAFFANPVGKGERITAIAPLKRIAVRSQVVAPRANVQLFTVEGRELFVPLIAFNALYRWGSGEGQTSSAYLVGRDTKSDKLAPMRADLGPRQFRGLGARPLPNAVRD